MTTHLNRRAALLSLTTAVVVAVLTASGCSKNEGAPQPVVDVQVAKAERGEIQQIIQAEAILFPRDQSAITPKVSAPVKEFYVNRGSQVHKGELLAVLENPCRHRRSHARQPLELLCRGRVQVQALRPRPGELGGV